MTDLFDGSADFRRYERSAFITHPCELIAFENYDSYTLTRLSFEGRDTYLFIIKSKILIEPAIHGTFAHFISNGAALVFSIGGMSYIANSKAVKTVGGTEMFYYAGFDAAGTLRMIPDGILSAVESGIVHGTEASPFLVFNGKRLIIKDEIKRSRDRLLLVQLKSGEPAFIYIKNCDIARAADYTFQLGCERAAVIANEQCIEIYSKSIILNRQTTGKAVFVIR